MYQTGLYDGSFGHQFSATLGGENDDMAPQSVKWLRDQFGSYSTFFTDMCLEKVIDAPGITVAWLLEPPSLHDTHYRKAVELEDHFDYILTFDTKYLERGDKWLYYPLGGSWIEPPDWKVWDKAKSVSIIVSEKTGAVGHQMRHEAVRRFHQVDVWGRGYTRVASKVTALAQYRYSIVIESVKLDAYFSEKLIDCLSQGTIPIYWGCPSIGDFFDLDGIIPFDSLDDLPRILEEEATPKYYEKNLASVYDNLAQARSYAVAEEWIAKTYPFLFGDLYAKA